MILSSIIGHLVGAVACSRARKNLLTIRSCGLKTHNQQPSNDNKSNQFQRAESKTTKEN